jgi:adenylate cyclase
MATCAFSIGAGNLALKNVERPIHAFEVKWNPAAWKFRAAVPGAPSIGPAPPTADVPLTLPDKPSIAVLPFQNMSGDPEQEYFTDGITSSCTAKMSSSTRSSS